jgi:hypothetical protein
MPALHKYLSVSGNFPRQKLTLTITYRIMKLNLFAFDNEDERILQNSYNSFKSKTNIELVENEIELDQFLNSIKNRISINPSYSLKIQNLFKLVKENGKVYIGQILLDKFYHMPNKHAQSFEREYDFYIFGLCETTLDLGNSSITLETKSDKILKKLWIKDIEIGNSTTFNDKFKICTNRKNELEIFLNDDLISELKKQDDIIITFEASKIFFSFDNYIKSIQTRAIECLFGKMKHIKK